jgi:MGT family glycosyltransferase
VTSDDRHTDRRHEVTILSQPSVAAAASAAGARFEPLQGVDDYGNDQPIEEQLERVLPVLVGDQTGHQAARLADEIGADVVVIDPNLAGVLAAAEAADRPSAVLLHSMFATFVDVWFADLWPLLGTEINHTREQLGVPAADSWADLFAHHDLVLSPVPEQFNPKPIESTAPVRHVGFLVPSTDQSVKVDRGEGPRVLVSLSTTQQGQRAQLTRMLDAIGDLPVHAVLTTSSAVPHGDLRPPPNVQVETWIPHAALLPSMDLVVTHGGLGTVAASLAHGVPMVCQPISRDQPLNAERVRHLGAGVVIADDAGTDAIASAIDHVLSTPSYRDAAHRLSSASRAAGQEKAAADALLALSKN